MRRFITLLLMALTIACSKPEEMKPASEAERMAGEPGIQKEKEDPALSNQTRNGKRIEFPAANGVGSGYLSVPAAQGKHPAIIVIQEWWGVEDWIKENTDKFAGEGYVALAVDLYRGRIAANQEEAHELMRGLPQDRAMADLKGAIDYLSSQPYVDPTRIGVIGWCMGGGYALTLATTDPRVKATVINYGHLVTDPATIQKINGPLMGNFAGQDRGIPSADVQQFQTALQSSGKTADIKIYPEQGHAFMNPKNTQGFDPKAAEDAWGRIWSFFKTNLQPVDPKP